MKIKQIITLLLLSFCTISFAQKNVKDYYEVTFFKWVKNGEKDEKVFIKIDSLGSIYVNNKKSDKTVNRITFNKGIHKFVNLERLKKVPGNNEPPQMAIAPQKDKQNIYVNIIFLKDYYNETELANKTTFKWSRTDMNLSKDNYLIYSYLDKKDKEVIQYLLK